MKSYWFKIIFGAMGIFLVGMLVVTAIRKTRNQVRVISQTSDPINIPFPFGIIPFKLNGTKLGSIQHLTLLRDAPKGISNVRLTVKLADSMSADQLADCFLVVDDVQHINERTTFRCVKSDTAGMALVPYGIVSLEGNNTTFPLLLPASEIANLRSDGADQEIEDSADSLATAAQELADSIREVNLERADSIRDEMLERADSIREAALHLADSVRQMKTVGPERPARPRRNP
ncbi:MAG: hypothetical protein ABI679_14250 [Gemmatimonadota bacterium]